MPSLLAFRANVIYTENGSDVLVRSPAYGQFKWTERVVWAECQKCPRSKWGHVDIQEECDCGIHATLDPNELRNYAYTNEMSVPMMVEALDNAWMHDAGITASGVAIVAIVRYRKDVARLSPWEETTYLMYGKKNLALATASKFFGVPIVDYETAVYAVEMKWNEYGGGDPPFPYHLYPELYFQTTTKDGQTVWLPGKET
jgi:hypothetical protein